MERPKPQKKPKYARRERDMTYPAIFERTLKQTLKELESRLYPGEKP